MTNDTINFLVDHMGASQMAFHLVKAANELSEEHGGNTSVFYDQLHRPCRPLRVPSMMLMEAWAQPGVSIATSIPTMARLLTFPGPQVKLFYVWDMSWLKNPKRAGQAASLFRDPELDGIIARCEDHAHIIRNNFNVEVRHVFDNFSVPDLIEALRNEYHNRTVAKQKVDA
jgi:hypothetical protein